MLYNPDILRLVGAVPADKRLADAHGTSERRSPVCGSRVTVDVRLGADGRVAEAGMLVRACALGQASAALLDAGLVGRSPEELGAARDELADWLAGGEAAPSWPGLDVFTPALPLTARHASVRLAFEAAAEAAERAAAARAS